MKQILYLMVVLLHACTSTNNTFTIQTNGSLTLLDSAASAATFLPYASDEIRHGFYPVFYLGNKTDTIRLGQKPIYEWSSGGKIYPYYNSCSIDSTKMKIIVDTTFLLTYTKDYWHYSHEKEQKIIDSVVLFHAYPIFVYNVSDSLFDVGIYNHLGNTIRQAKNEQGNWVDIETPINYFCGTSARRVVIEPKQVLIAKLLRYKGTFKTACRLKFIAKQTAFCQATSVYSTIFMDYIDKRQLIDIRANTQLVMAK